MKNPFYRKPDMIIGQAGKPYMRRWFVIPRNRFLNIYLHHFLHDDEDRALHDHPWPSLSIILKGKYIEHLLGGKSRVGNRWNFIYRRATHTHRIQLFRKVHGPCTEWEKPLPVWTLFITGPKIRSWGFHCPQGWRHWSKFVNPTNEGEVGPGCD